MLTGIIIDPSFFMPIHTHNEHKELVLLCKAAANERRIHSIHKTKKRGYSLQELAKEEGVRLSAMSRHQNILLRAKLVTSKRQGKKVIWRTNPDIDIDLLLELVKRIKRR